MIIENRNKNGYEGMKVIEMVVGCMKVIESVIKDIKVIKIE